jgi:hypothetical protein
MLKYVDPNDPTKIFLWHDICFIQFFLLPSQRTGTHLVDNEIENIMKLKKYWTTKELLPYGLLGFASTCTLCVPRNRHDLSDDMRESTMSKNTLQNIGYVTMGHLQLHILWLMRNIIGGWSYWSRLKLNPLWTIQFYSVPLGKRTRVTSSLLQANDSLDLFSRNCNGTMYSFSCFLYRIKSRDTNILGK